MTGHIKMTYRFKCPSSHESSTFFTLKMTSWVLSSYHKAASLLHYFDTYQREDIYEVKELYIIIKNAKKVLNRPVG